MYCFKCGKKIDEDSKFCEYCGTKVKQSGVIDNIKDSIPDDVKQKAKKSVQEGVKKTKEVTNKVIDNIPDNVKDNVKNVEAEFASNLPPILKEHKKIMYGGIVVVLLLACFISFKVLFGGKTLTCSNTSGNLESVYKVKFVRDKAKSAVLTLNIDLSDLSQSKIDEGIKNLKKLYQKDGVKLSIKQKKKKVQVKMSGDVEDISKLTDGDLDDENVLYENVKKDLEDSNFTCK